MSIMFPMQVLFSSLLCLAGCEPQVFNPNSLWLQIAICLWTFNYTHGKGTQTMHQTPPKVGLFLQCGLSSFVFPLWTWLWIFVKYIVSREGWWETHHDCLGSWDQLSGSDLWLWGSEKHTMIDWEAETSSLGMLSGTALACQVTKQEAILLLPWNLNFAVYGAMGPILSLNIHCTSLFCISN